MKKEVADLAINGGPKAITTPFPARFLFSEEEKEAADDLFDQSITSGVPFGYKGEQEEAYCREFAEFMGGGHADGVNSGTNALYIALRALDLPPFSEVVVPPITDPGGMMPVPLLNCIPVVGDSQAGCYNTGPQQVEKVITPLTSAIVVAHIGGEPVDMDGIVEIAQKHEIPVVEDCAQAHGASINGKKVGAFGDIAAFSTMSGKHHCMGGQGGVVFTRDEQLYRKARQAADRGKPFGLDKGATNCIASLNFNLDELSAAIGRVQLRKLPRIIENRQYFADRLRPALESLDSVRIPELIAGGEHVYWWWRLAVAEENLTCSKDDYCAALAAEGVALNPDYSFAMPHRQQWFTDRNVFGDSQLPWSSPGYKGDADRKFPTENAAAATACQFNLSIFESWGEKEANALADAFKKVNGAYRR